MVAVDEILGVAAVQKYREESPDEMKDEIEAEMRNRRLVYQGMGIRMVCYWRYERREFR